METVSNGTQTDDAYYRDIGLPRPTRPPALIASGLRREAELLPWQWAGAVLAGAVLGWLLCCLILGR